MNSKKLFSLISAAFLTGCAITTPVQLASSGKSKFEGALYPGQVVELDTPVAEIDKYRVFQQGATGFVSIQIVRSGVEEIAIDFCAQQSKTMFAITKIASKPPYILGNFPRVELIFQCLERKTAKLIANETTKYDKLSALKNLFESGVVTQQEFDTEKAKVLTEP